MYLVNDGEDVVFVQDFEFDVFGFVVVVGVLVVDDFVVDFQ